MTNDAAKEEAKRENVFHLVCIGAKERIAKDIINRAGTNITNPVLCHTDRVRFKKVDEY